MTRIILTGVPRSGKTTAAWIAVLGVRAEQDAPLVTHTDEFRHMEWPAQEAAVAAQFGRPGPWLVEGVSATRALRRWLKEHPSGSPADRIEFLNHPFVPLSKGQENMAKGLRTVWGQIKDELRRRGAEVIER